MIDYLYDGTFEGFLNCVHAHYYQEKASGVFQKESYQSTMLSNYCEVETEEEKALIVYKAIEEKISSFDLRRIYRVFLSSAENKENILLDYIRLGFIEGGKVSLFHGNPYVHAVQQVEKKVTFEVHRMAGLVRFSVLEGEILYCPLEPDHDILELIAGHFSDRFKCDPFIIHDKRRNKALVAQNNSWYITQFTDDNLPKLSENEKEYRRLWKSYFENIAIKERVNPRCQKNFMPVRYWKNLTEMR